MHWTSIIAISVLFWVMSAFVLLPFGVRTHDEMGLEKMKMVIFGLWGELMMLLKIRQKN